MSVLNERQVRAKVAKWVATEGIKTLVDRYGVTESYVKEIGNQVRKPPKWALDACGIKRVERRVSTISYIGEVDGDEVQNDRELR
ncbi:hypothetical protein V757_12230 [Pelistega indica]|uniref:Uncharacterized protein n=1 Tax=Pelistega indica TaxID=1414851 RepID=V8FRD1_9BURK|nr:hypothetical protein [Pelistega indica]ETD66720.1 hypothetical protein V757_12230 [Pelistega indica]